MCSNTFVRIFLAFGCLTTPAFSTPAAAAEIEIVLKALTDSFNRQAAIAGNTNVAVSFAYATPQPDAQLRFRIGNNNTATAFDNDFGPASFSDPSAVLFRQSVVGIPVAWSQGRFTPEKDAFGKWFSAARGYRNGLPVDGDTGGSLPPGTGLINLPININNLPLQERLTINMHTGMIGSFTSIMGGGAQFLGGTWQPWSPFEEFDPVVRSYFDGSFPPDSNSNVPPFQLPSTDLMFESDLSSGSVDWFPYFQQAVQNAGTHEVDGQLFFNNFSFVVPLAAPIPAIGNWYADLQITARDEVAIFEPSTLSLLGVAMLSLLAYFCRPRKRLWTP